MSNLYGRTTIYANYTEDEILSASNSPKRLDNIIIDILSNAKTFHEQNKNQIAYLKRYFYGEQDVLNKEKHTREEINNKIVENWAYACIDFKKTYLLGKPIQYVSLDDTSKEEISILNKYVRFENKKAKDMELYEDILVAGRGFRYINKDKKQPPDDAPFEIINCPVEDTEVVYSSGLGGEQLLAFIQTDMQKYVTMKGDNDELVTVPYPYEEYTVYLRNMVLVYSNESGELKRKGKPKLLIYNEHIINEYYLNRNRISLIELGKDLFDAINNLESLDADDLEQFVNAIYVFINAQVSGEEFDEIKDMGAVCINSDENKKASVDLLQGALNSQNTQINYNRLLNALHQILGIPVASEYGIESTGDTGRAKLTGQGYTSAGIRIEGDETMFSRCDFNSLKVILKVCKENSESGIVNLKPSDIDSKFQRDMSDNLLVKTQGLMNLYACDIPREYANAIVNLFSDPNAITQQQEKLFGEQTSQQNKGTSSGSGDSNQASNTTKPNDRAKEQNNNISNAFQSNMQEQ